MKGSWIRKMAVILSLCLFLNSGLLDLAGYVYAATDDSAPISTEETVEVEETPNISVQNIDTPNEDLKTEKTDENVNEEIEEEKDEEIEKEKDEEKEEDSAKVVEVLEDGTMVLEDGTWILPDGTRVLENGTQILPDGTVIEPAPVILMSETDGEITSNIPATVEEYLAAKKTSYSIQYAEDFIRIQELCKDPAVNGFAGVTFTILSEAEAEDTVWKTSEMIGFTGIGTDENPFKGTMHCYFEIGKGVQLRLDKPLFSYVGEGAEIYNLDIIADGCVSPIAENIRGNVSIHDVLIQGTIGSGSGNTGTIAGKIEAGTVTLVNVVSTANITGEIAGGLAGVIESGVTIVLDEASAIGTAGTSITVTGSSSAGGFFGEINGDYTLDLAWMDRVSASVIGAGASAYIGQLAGSVKEAAFTVKNGNSITANVSGTGNGGGLVGLCADGASIILPMDENGVSVEFIVNGSIAAEGGAAGGIIGEIRDSNMEIRNCTVTASVSGGYAGGIVGKVSGSKEIIDAPTVRGTLNGSTYTGGVIGQVANVSAIELQGTIDVQSVTFSGGDKGSVVGENVTAGQQESLIYLSGVQGKVDGNDQLKVPLVSGDIITTHNDVCNYGGIFRNQQLANNSMLIGDGTLENVGVINNKIEWDGTYYQLGTDGEMDAAADLETFAIAQYTDGNFGVNAFVGAASCSDLLRASYKLNSNADISYNTTGIVTLNRHDIRTSDTAFSGVLEGKDESITITQNSFMKRWFIGGVFCDLADASFKNLIIDGVVRCASNTGGLAYETVGSSLTLENIQMKKEYTVENYQCVGGLLAKESSSSAFTLNAENIVLASKINAGSLEKHSGFITEMDNVTLNVNGVKLGGNITSTAGTAGGFLGKTWTQVDGTIEDVSVLESVTYANGTIPTTYTASGVFGGLLHTATNKAGGSRLTLDGVDLANLTVNMNRQSECSLLINNGQQLVLEVIDYSAAGATVNNASSDFDEVVALNYVDDLKRRLYSVVSLHKTGKTFPDYHYEYQADYNGSIPQENSKTRYYYDVFQHLDTVDGEGNRTNAVTIAYDGSCTISNAAEFLLWDIVQCTLKCESRVYDTFKGYFSSGSVPENAHKTYYFEGNLDLSDYSIYPVPRQYDCEYIGLEDATITFAAGSAAPDTKKPDDTTGMAGWAISNEKQSQHGQLHAGLFADTTGMITVKDLTLTGTIAGNDSAYLCGALVAGQLSYGGVFENITLKNLSINQYKGDGASLLIGNIPSGNVSFDGINMEGYNKEDYKDTKAGAALIYAAGGEDVTDLVLKFHNMVIEYDREAVGVDEDGTILKYASFIYKYDYTDDAGINEGSGLYLFSQADAESGNVTYGAELDYETEYSDNTNKVFTEGEDPVPETVYIPYVYKQEDKDIDVNPKSGDILRGCGTYEDPYIIETTKQFLTLYRYMNEPEKAEGEEYQYQDFYENWKVIKMGDDSSFCSTKHNVRLAAGDEAEGAVVEAIGGLQLTGDGLEDVRVFGEEGFPTPDELSHAYYLLGADINLAEITSATYKTIAADFVGFGTLERPFTGVWYGTDEEGQEHTVTLPDKLSTATYTTYGFIQYAQGAVVKDITIVSNKNVEGKDTVAAQVSTAGGTVISTILGGDNIIDGVTVSAQLHGINRDTAIGGYVGNVKKGGVILRNMQDTSLSDFVISCISWDSISNYYYFGSVVGKVEDGYVIYEGDSSEEYYYVGKGGNSTYEAIPNYTILNGNKLEDEAGISVELTAVDGSDTDKNITVTIPSEAGLQVMSMALNADALNVCPSDYQPDLNIIWGYSEKSRSRKAAYDKIGACASASERDYIKAAAYDNVMGYSEDADKAYAYPYLYQYMGITEGGYLTYFNNDFSVMNPAETVNGVNYHVYWDLAENTTYDMGVFDNNNDADSSFRGIGALYQPGEGYGATFRGDFDGNNSTVILTINRDLRGAEENGYEYLSVKRAGLFNVLYAPTNDTQIQGIYNHLTDAFEDINGTTGVRPYYIIKDVKLGGSIITTIPSGGGTVYAGGIAGEIVTGNYIFDNIGIAEESFAIGKVNQGKISNFGGIVGRIGVEWQQSGSYILIQNCNWGREDSEIVLKGNAHGGGFVGESTAKVLKIVDCNITRLNLNSGNQNGGKNTGGFVGYANQSAGSTFIMGTSKDSTFVKNSIILGWTHSGGLIGCAVSPISIKNTLSDGNIIRAYNNMGGIAGQLGGTRTSEIQMVNVKDMKSGEIWQFDGQPSGIGGVVGKNEHILLIEDAAVTGTKENDTYTSQLKGVARARTASNGVGGIVGWNGTNPLTLRDCNVSDIYIETNCMLYGNQRPGIYAGGLVGYTNKDVFLDGTISTSGLTVKAPKYSDFTYANSDDAKMEKMAAGGCFGMIDGSKVSSYDPADEYYKGLTATDNIVSGRYAGGIAGYAYAANTRLQGVKVSGGEIISDRDAGGIYGSVMPSYNGLAFNPLGTWKETEEEYKNVVSDVKISGMVAGGLFGYASLTRNSMRIENITVENCEITAAKYHTIYSAGGLIGELAYGNADEDDLSVYGVTLDNNVIVCENEGTTIAAAKIIYPAAGGLVGRISDTDKTGEFLCDGLTLKPNNQIGIRNSAAGAIDTSVKLLKYNGNEYELADAELPTSLQSDEILVEEGDTGYKNYEAIESLVAGYGYCVGTMVGVNESANVELYIWRSQDENDVFDTPVMGTNPPVTDVGRNEEVELIAGNEKYFRNNAHIVYGAPVTEITDNEGNSYKASDASKNLAYMKKRVDETNQEYVKESTDFTTLLQNYRLSQDSVTLFENLYEESYVYPGIDYNYTISEPILVLKAEYGTVQELLETLTDIMTNMAGYSASDISEDRLKITTAQKVVTQDDVVSGSGEASITASIADSVVTYESPRYDGVTEEGLTYTEITFIYGMVDQNHQKVFRLPVFVEEPILCGTHMKIMEGRASSVEDIRKKGILASNVPIQMANDSDYTLLLEYTYGKARKNMPESVITEKYFYLIHGENEAKTIAEGTKLLLIDVTNGNKPYYYTVESNDTTKVKFSDFKDSEGNAYVNKPICMLPDVGEVSQNGEILYTDIAEHIVNEAGVEMFLLTVLSEEESSEVYTIHTDMKPQVAGEENLEEDQKTDVASQFAPWDELHEEMPKQPVVAIPGLTISLNVLDGNTRITGEISKDGSLAIKATFSLTAEDVYWQYHQTGGGMTDSENNGKYLELGFYLRDENGNRVSLPNGTNFSYKIGDNYSNNKIIEDNSIVYYYKDIRNLFENDDMVYQISDINKNTDVTVEFNLNFAGADLSSVTNDSYMAWVELLRTANKDYPMGSGNSMGTYSEQINATAANELGFAIKAEDVNTLAINTYPQAAGLNNILYQTMFDFSSILDRISGAGKEAALENWAGFDYEVTYQLYQKTQNDAEVVYEPYTEDDILIKIMSDDGWNVLKDSQGGLGSVTAVYNFTVPEIEEGLVTRPNNLAIATKALLGEDGETLDLAKLTNYKIVARLVIKERSLSAENPGDSEAEAVTEDFFIFTVTKLKTDLSE